MIKAYQNLARIS